MLHHKGEREVSVHVPAVQLLPTSRRVKHGAPLGTVISVPSTTRAGWLPQDTSHIRYPVAPPGKPAWVKSPRAPPPLPKSSADYPDAGDKDLVRQALRREDRLRRGIQVRLLKAERERISRHKELVSVLTAERESHRRTVESMQSTESAVYQRVEEEAVKLHIPKPDYTMTAMTVEMSEQNVKLKAVADQRLRELYALEARLAAANEQVSASARRDEDIGNLELIVAEQKRRIAQLEEEALSRRQTDLRQTKALAAACKDSEKEGRVLEQQLGKQETELRVAIQQVSALELQLQAREAAQIAAENKAQAASRAAAAAEAFASAARDEAAVKADVHAREIAKVKERANDELSRALAAASIDAAAERAQAASRSAAAEEAILAAAREESALEAKLHARELAELREQASDQLRKALAEARHQRDIAKHEAGLREGLECMVKRLEAHVRELSTTLSQVSAHAEAGDRARVTAGLELQEKARALTTALAGVVATTSGATSEWTHAAALSSSRVSPGATQCRAVAVLATSEM
jgi:hypothetical protein